METQRPLSHTWTRAAQQSLPFNMDTPTLCWTTRVSFTSLLNWHFPSFNKRLRFHWTIPSLSWRKGCFWSMLFLEMIDCICSSWFDNFTLRFPSFWISRSWDAGRFPTSQQHHICCGTWILGFVSSLALHGEKCQHFWQLVIFLSW